MILFHVHDGIASPTSRIINGDWTAVSVPLNDLRRSLPATARDLLFDVNLTVLSTALAVRAAIRDLPEAGLRIFACPRGDRHWATQADALGANAIVDRPVADANLERLLATAAPAETKLASVTLGGLCLDQAFAALTSGQDLASANVEAVASEIARDIKASGLSAWIETMRDHHAGTYRHCLLVTGLATAFGQELGFRATDLAAVTAAALLHDIGKARISPAILDKPGRLDADELALIRLHPVWGANFLVEHSTVSAPIQAAVRHHHEYLDGTGYPDGLSGRQIDDITRLVTISDVFAALTEPRSYKASQPVGRSLAILRSMCLGGKLERVLVDAFEPVARRMAPA